MASYNPLKIQGLEVKLGGKKVVNNVSLSVNSVSYTHLTLPTTEAV